MRLTIYRCTTALALLASLAACTKSEKPAASAPPAVASGPRDGGTLIRRLESDTDTLNYLLQTTDYERNVLAYIYDPLVDLNSDLEPIPATATRWDISSDGKTYTFYLDPLSTFSDGSHVTAGDVVFTIQKIVQDEAPQFLAGFGGVDLKQTTAVDEHTVRVVFSEARASQLLAFNIGILPKHIYEKGNFKTDHNDAPVGNGPYRFVRRDPGKEIVLERRSDARRKAHIQRIVFKVISNDATAWQALKLGQIDEMRVRPETWNREKSDAGVQRLLNVHTFFLLAYNCIPWNVKDRLLADAALRRALAMCFDRPAIIRDLYAGAARPITGPFSPDSWAYDQTVQPVPYDPDAAGRELERLGWKDTNADGIRERNGRKLAFNLIVPAGNVSALQQAQVFQAGLRKAGAGVTVQPIESTAFFGSLMKGDYQAAYFGWTIDPDPDVYALFHSSQTPPAGLNIVRYASADADRLLVEGRTTLDRARRAEIYHRLHQLLARDQPYTWTVQPPTYWAVNRRVKNVTPAKGLGLYQWYPGPLDWYLDDGK